MTTEVRVIEVCVAEVCISEVCVRLCIDVIDNCMVVELSSGERERIMVDIFNENFDESIVVVGKDVAAILRKPVTTLEVKGS